MQLKYIWDLNTNYIYLFNTYKLFLYICLFFTCINKLQIYFKYAKQSYKCTLYMYNICVIYVCLFTYLIFQNTKELIIILTWKAEIIKVLLVFIVKYFERPI